MGMLVLSRKLDEEIIINGNIRIHVIEIRGDKVRIGIDAPREMTVHRKEVADEIALERRKKDSEFTPGIGEDFG